MNSNLSTSKCFTVRQAAWVLGVSRSTVSRLVRVGAMRAEGRRGELVIPAREVVRLLGGAG